ncbi:MAG: nucleotidyltransferase domain-containing protein, partial [Candidatus Jacksonbacteria bacterium]
MSKTNLAKLKTYFKNRDDVLMAFLFGSQAKGYSTKRSDWDIGVYLKPKSGWLEWDTGKLYP